MIRDTLTRSEAGVRRVSSRRMTPARLEALYGWLFISPAVIGLVVFSLGPILASLYISFYKTVGVSLGSFVGITNYQNLVLDQFFWQSLKVSFTYAIGVVPASIVLQLIVASALNRGVRGISLFRLLYYLPVITPTVAMILVWMYIYDSQFGLLNMLLRFLSLPKQDWLGSIRWALPSFMVMGIWASIGSGMVLFLAGLQSIPQSYYDAAAIDGAGTLAKFRHITVPLVSPVTFFTLVLGLIGALQTFDAVFVATGGDGSPFYSTLVIGLYIYQNAFIRFQFGYASAIAWALALIIFALTYFQLRLQNRWVHYGG